jgi:hypothetical protein
MATFLPRPASIDINRLCRRRSAAMRVYHWVLLLSSLGGIMLACLGSVTRIVGRGGDSGSDAGDLLIAGMVALSLMIVVIWRWRFVRACERGDLGEPLQTTSSSQLSSLQEDVIRYLASPRVSFHVIIRGSAAQVVRTRRGVHIVLAASTLALLDTNPDSFAAIVLHETGHCRQWDDSLGHWTLRATSFVAYLFLMLGGLVLIGLLFFIPATIARGLRLFSPEIGLPVLGLLVAQLIMFVLFAGGRFWYRFAEYNADLFTVAAGKGVALTNYLGARQKQRGWLRNFFAIHPSAERRIRRIARYTNQTASAWRDGLFQPLRWREYVDGGAAYVLPSAAVFQAITWGFISFVRSILPPG